MPKLLLPPFNAQKRSAFSLTVAVTISPYAVTTSYYVLGQLYKVPKLVSKNSGNDYLYHLIGAESKLVTIEIHSTRKQ